MVQVHDNLETICNEVIDTCLYKGSRDNMSIIIIAFPNAPKPDPAAIKVEKELNQLLEKKVNEIIDNDGDVELSSVFQILAEQNMEGYPPGGGFSAKKVFVEDLYKKLLPQKYESTQDECPNPLASLLFANAQKSTEDVN